MWLDNNSQRRSKEVPGGLDLDVSKRPRANMSPSLRPGDGLENHVVSTVGNSINTSYCDEATADRTTNTPPTGLISPNCVGG